MPTGSHSQPLLLGHRGCRLPKNQENFLSAFQFALDAGCDGFEFDVRQTSDGALVCLHDPTVGNLAVVNSTYSDISSEFFEKAFRRMSRGIIPMMERIPRLEDVLQRFGNEAFLDIELKTSGMEQSVITMIEKYRTESKFVISSFLPEVISTLAEIAPEIPLGLIFSDVAGLKAWKDFDLSYIMPSFDLITSELIDSAHRNRTKVLAWTVNDEADMYRLMEWGVDGLISDDPVKLCRAVRGTV